MPIYEYHCEKCGRSFEKMEPVASEKETTCECGAKAKRLISQSAFHLKGSGWYTSDYKSKPKQESCPAAKTDSPACSGCAANADK